MSAKVISLSEKEDSQGDRILTYKTQLCVDFRGQRVMALCISTSSNRGEEADARGCKMSGSPCVNVYLWESATAILYKNFLKLKT